MSHRSPRNIALAATAALSIGAAALPAGADAAKQPRFDPYVAYDGVCAESALMSAVNAFLPKGSTVAKAKKVRSRFAPRGVGQLTVDGRSYALKPDRSGDRYSARSVSWGFKNIKMSSDVGQALIGKRATLTYKTRARTMSLSTKVEQFGCG